MAMNSVFRSVLLLVLVNCTLLAWHVRADTGCAICGAPFGTEVYLLEDKVTATKKQVCYNCTMSSPRCFTCGLPVHGNFTEIGDGRVMCERDAKNAVLEEEEAKRICHDTKDDLDRLFSRFLLFPDTNVTMQLADRPHLEQLFKVIGNDYECPNVLGCMQTSTNHGRVEHQIRILSGLPLAGFKATYAHEYSHVWLNENLSDARKQSLHHDSIEGFCELISFMLMELQNDESQKKLILLNAYTRGQIQLFLEAKDRYGLEDVIDWMKSGTDAVLNPDDLGRIRSVEPTGGSSASVSVASLYSPPAQQMPDTLVLRGIVWSKKRPLALINDRGLELNEEAKVSIGKTNTAVRCLEINRDSVRIRLLASGEEQELKLKSAR